MGKKHDAKLEESSSKKKAAKAEKAAAKVEKGAAKAVKDAAMSSTTSKAAEKTSVKSAPASLKATSKPKAATISLADIQLRAYYVAEKRNREGRPGDTHSDWLEAERQLRSEKGVTAKAAPTAAKATPTAAKAAVKKTSRKVGA